MSFRPRGHLLASLAVLAIGGPDVHVPLEVDIAPQPPHRERRRGGKPYSARTAPKKKPNRAKGRKPRKQR